MSSIQEKLSFQSKISSIKPLLISSTSTSLEKTPVKHYKTPVQILEEHNIPKEIAFICPIIIDPLFQNYFQTTLNNYNKLYHHVPDPPVKFLLIDFL